MKSLLKTSLISVKENAANSQQCLTSQALINLSYGKYKALNQLVLALASAVFLSAKSFLWASCFSPLQLNVTCSAAQLT